MKHCHECGIELKKGKSFCHKCGSLIQQISNSHKKHWHVALTPVIIISLLLVSYLGYYNYSSHKEEVQSQFALNALRVKQEQLENEFWTTKQNKEYELESSNSRLNNQDNDGDGLTYAQEITGGTDDNNPDSDADGILDGEDEHPAGGGQNYKFVVNWQHNNLPYTTEFGIAEDRYKYYKHKERIFDHNQWGQYATPNDLVIKTIAEDIADAARITGSSPAYAAIDFVESMTYQFDIEFNSNSEYPKYAIETIVDKRGDCEDTSFLMASILQALNIDTIVLIYSDHVAVGVACDGCSGTYYNHKGRKYYFLETTSVPGSWQLGQIWGKYGSEEAKIIDV